MSEMHYPMYTQPDSKSVHREQSLPRGLGRAPIDGPFLRMRDLIDRIERMSLEKTRADQPIVDEALPSPAPEESNGNGSHEFASVEFEVEHLSSPSSLSDPHSGAALEYHDVATDDEDIAFAPLFANGHQENAEAPDPLAIYAVDYLLPHLNGEHTGQACFDVAAEQVSQKWSADLAPYPSDHPEVQEAATPPTDLESTAEETPGASGGVARSIDDLEASAGRWWINFNGELRLNRVARLRSRLQESPFVIEARFEQIEHGLIALRVVTGGAVTTAQMDWVLRQLLEAFSLNENCAILSPQ
jgi:hypothetical protein